MKYPEKPKPGDKVICKDDDSQDEDFGMSGIVLKGRNDLTKEKTYTIKEVVSDRAVPKKNSCWTKKEYEMVRWSWYEVYLEGVSDRTFLLNFEPA